MTPFIVGDGAHLTNMCFFQLGWNFSIKTSLDRESNWFKITTKTKKFQVAFPKISLFSQQKNPTKTPHHHLDVLESHNYST